MKVDLLSRLSGSHWEGVSSAGPERQSKPSNRQSKPVSGGVYIRGVCFTDAQSDYGRRNPRAVCVLRVQVTIHVLKIPPQPA